MSVKNAQFVLDEATFVRQVNRNPNFFAGWNGSATADITLVQGTENQYTYTSAIALVRTVPTVSWLQTRDRTSAKFSSSYDEITQPAYIDAGALLPAVNTEDAIFTLTPSATSTSPRACTGWRKRPSITTISQGLDLQQIYGAGLGKTVTKRATQQLDLKATLQLRETGVYHFGFRHKPGFHRVHNCRHLVAQAQAKHPLRPATRLSSCVRRHPGLLR